MKKSLALLALVFVLATVCGASAALDENRLGLFYDQAATIDEIDIAANSQQYLYLVLINPVSDLGTVQVVGGFECSIVPATGDYLLGVTFPLEAVNVGGSSENIVVGYAGALPISSAEGTVLATLSVLTMGNNPEGYFLQPPASPSLPNKMAYLDMGIPETLIVEAVPVSGSHDRPVFTFGDYTVEENKQWGDVKSLYR
jgi:hypothetical protein